jgi:hypothetical protein
MAMSDYPLTQKHKDKPLEQVSEFKCLESWIDYNGKIINEIKRRIGQATSAFNKLKPIWRRKYSMRFKFRLMNSNTLCIPLYASKFWKHNVQLKKRPLRLRNTQLIQTHL